MQSNPPIRVLHLQTRINCSSGCPKQILKALNKVSGISSKPEINVEKQEIKISGHFQDVEVIKAIEKTGRKVTVKFVQEIATATTSVNITNPPPQQPVELPSNLGPAQSLQAPTITSLQAQNVQNSSANQPNVTPHIESKPDEPTRPVTGTNHIQQHGPAAGNESGNTKHNEPNGFVSWATSHENVPLCLNSDSSMSQPNMAPHFEVGQYRSDPQCSCMSQPNIAPQNELHTTYQVQQYGSTSHANVPSPLNTDSAMTQPVSELHQVQQPVSNVPSNLSWDSSMNQPNTAPQSENQVGQRSEIVQPVSSPHYVQQNGHTPHNNSSTSQSNIAPHYEAETTQPISNPYQVQQCEPIPWSNVPSCLISDSFVSEPNKIPHNGENVIAQQHELINRPVPEINQAQPCEPISHCNGPQQAQNNVASTSKPNSSTNQPSKAQQNEEKMCDLKVNIDPVEPNSRTTPLVQHEAQVMRDQPVERTLTRHNELLCFTKTTMAILISIFLMIAFLIIWLIVFHNRDRDPVD